MTTQSASNHAAHAGHSPEARIAERLTALWQRQRPEFAARVEVLERAAIAATDASLTPEMRAEAAALAHKLAGSLGLYGHVEAGKAARRMELLLEGAVSPNGQELEGCAKQLRRVVAL